MNQIKVKSDKQSHGITADIINVSKVEKKPKSKLSKWITIPPIISTIIAILTFLNYDSMFKKQSDPAKVQEVSYAKSENQTGGVTAGKIENLNMSIFTDKESLGIKEPLGLYKDGKKVGMVVNPVIDEKEMIFTFDEIRLDKPIPNNDSGFFFLPFEFDKYIVQATHIDAAVTMMPPGAKGVKGKILKIK